MAITVTNKIFNVSGGRAQITANLAFDSSYPAGGNNLYPDELFGMHTVEFALISPASGYSFEYDYTNKKIKAFAPAPPIIYDEKHTVTGDVITTNYPAAFIMNISRTGTNKKLRSTGIALASLGDDEACLVSKMAAGERTQIRVKDYDRLLGTGAFTGALTGWTDSGAGADWTAADDKADKDQDGTTTLTEATFVPVIGRTYRISYVISDWTVGTCTLSVGGVTLTAASADGSYSEDIVATAVTGLVITPSDTSRFTIDDVTVYDLSEPVYITYVTQAWKDVWDNLVQDKEVTLSTGLNTLNELMPNAVDRNFSAASAWTNVSINSYDETAGGDLSLTANAIGQYCSLPIASAPTEVGKSYTLTLDLAAIASTWTIKDFYGSQTIGTLSANGAGQTFTFTATTAGGLRLVAVANNSAGNFDNFSLCESPGDQIIACMYVDQTTATAAALTMIDEDDSAASGEIAIKFNQATAQLSCNTAQDAKAIKITYIKNPLSGFLYERSFDNETLTKRASGSTYLNTYTKPVLLWGYSGQMPVNGGATQRMIDAAATPGAGEFVPYWNKTARTIPAPPPLVVEELVTVTSNLTATLAYIPLYIVAVEALATATPVVCNVIPVGKTPITKQVSVDFTTGGLTFRAADSITTAKITYIPKRDAGYLSSVTVDEAFATAAAATPRALTVPAGLVQYVWDNTDGLLMGIEQGNVEPHATHFVQIEQVTATSTKIDTHASEDGNTMWVTYVPLTQLPPGCYIDDTDITLSSEIWNFTGDPGVLGYNHTVVPGYGTQVAGEEAGADPHYGSWVGPTGTDGNGIALWNPAKNSITTDDTTAITILTMTWMALDVDQLTPALPRYGGQIIDLASNVTGTLAGVWGDIDELQNLQPLEVKDGTNLSGLSMRIIMIGN